MICLGNPASVGAVGTSRGMSEEQAYLEKWRQLQKYIEPLKRMINRIDKDEGIIMFTTVIEVRLCAAVIYLSFQLLKCQNSCCNALHDSFIYF